MMRVCHTAWNSLRANGFATSEAMNSDRSLDVQVYVECRNHFANNWWVGHRNGSAGLQNPNTADIQNFKAGEDWTNQMIQDDGGHQCDDVRFWVNLPPKSTLIDHSGYEAEARGEQQVQSAGVALGVKEVERVFRLLG